MTDEQRATSTEIARLDVSIVDPGETDGSSFGLLPRAALLAKTIAHTDFVKASLRGKPAAVAAAILTGHELGIGPMMALSRLNVIDGQVVLDAQGMRALVQSKGHEIFFTESTSTRCTAVGIRRGSTRETVVTWTIEDARRAKLLGKPRSAWETYPRAMLVARATSELCRMIFSDVLGGVAYSAEEIADGLEGLRDASPDGETTVLEAELPAETPPSTTRQAPARRRRAAAGAADQAAAAGPSPSPQAARGTAAPEGPPPAPSAPTQSSWADLKVPGDDVEALRSRAPEPAPPAPLEPPPPPDDTPTAGGPGEALTAPAAPEAPPPPESGPGTAMEPPQQVAMWARDAGVERDQLCRYASDGRTDSARELTTEEVARALDAARAIARGEKKLTRAPNGGWIVTARNLVEISDEAIALLGRLTKRNANHAREFLAGLEWPENVHSTMWIGGLQREPLLRVLGALRTEVRRR